MLARVLVQAAILLLPISVIVRRCGEVRWALVMSSVGLVALDQIATGHTSVYDLIPGTAWNWQGKLAATAIALAVLTAMPARGRTGSLSMPMALHALVNTAPSVARTLR